WSIRSLSYGLSDSLVRRLISGGLVSAISTALEIELSNINIISSLRLTIAEYVSRLPGLRQYELRAQSRRCPHRKSRPRLRGFVAPPVALRGAAIPRKYSRESARRFRRVRR